MNSDTLTFILFTAFSMKLESIKNTFANKYYEKAMKEINKLKKGYTYEINKSIKPNMINLNDLFYSYSLILFNTSELLLEVKNTDDLEKLSDIFADSNKQNLINYILNYDKIINYNYMS